MSGARILWGKTAQPACPTGGGVNTVEHRNVSRMHNHIAVRRSTVVFTGPSFDVVEERTQHATGYLGRHITIRHPGAAVILPRQADGTLIVIRQYRHSLRQSLLEFPAGTREPGEAPLTCAQRELIEETGYQAQQWELLGQLHPAAGFCNEVQYCFLATALSPCAAKPDADELIELAPMTSEAVAQAILDGAMTDAKSIGIYTHAKLRGLV